MNLSQPRLRLLVALTFSTLVWQGLQAEESAGPIRFRKTQLDTVFRSEGATVGDFNGNGRLDIAAGSVYYAAPDWHKVPVTEEPQQFPVIGYSNAFLCFTSDVNRNGRDDLLVVGFPGQETRWYENPGDTGGVWNRYDVIPVTNGENPLWVDLTGDGQRELIAGVPEMGWARPGADPTAAWETVIVSGPEDPRIGRYYHGFGVGDVNGNGRLDILVREGWWEAPEDRTQVPWTFHRVDFGPPCAQMLVYDFDGDGRPDVLTTSAHQYGIWWHQQTDEGWITHEIDRSFSQTHAVVLADINGNGRLDFVTGKRYYAHNGNDPGADDPALLCWYELQHEDGQPVWTRHVIDNDSGVGMHFEVVDMNGNGLLDIATANKKGVFYFEQIPAAEDRGGTAMRVDALRSGHELGDPLGDRTAQVTGWRVLAGVLLAVRGVFPVAAAVAESGPPAGSPAERAEVSWLDGVTDYPSLPVAREVLPDPVVLDLPLNKAGWPDQGTPLLTEDQVWGGRIDIRQIFPLGGQWALLYGSRPAGQDRGQASLGTSLAFSADLHTWHDSPLNPVFDSLDQPWQGSRARAEALIYDTRQERWVLFFGGNGHQHIPGLRAVGIAYSENLRDWVVEQANPVVTLATGDIRRWGAGDEVVRIYPVAVRQHRGKWYLFLSAGGPAPGVYKAVYHIGVLVADDPAGPWHDPGTNPILTHGAEGEWDEQGVFAAGGLTRHQGRWLLTYANRFGHVGFAVSDSEDPTRGWSKAPDNPYIEGTEVRRALVLKPLGNTWNLFYSALHPDGGLDSGDPRRLFRMTYEPPHAEER